MGETPLVPLQNWKDYTDVKKDIRDCDLFLFRGNYRTSRLFEKLDFSYYSHAAFVLRWDERLMILQAEGKGIEAIPLSVCIGEYPGRVDWYKLKHESFPDIANLQVALRKVAAEGKSDLGVSDGYLALLKNLAHWAFNFKLTDPTHPKGMFCSQYVEHCFRTGGIPIAQSEAEGDGSRPPSEHWFRHRKPRSDIATFPKHIAYSPHVEYAATIRHNPKHEASREDDDVIPEDMPLS